MNSSALTGVTRGGTVNLTQNFSYLGRNEPALKQTINDLKPLACPKCALKSVKLTIHPRALTVSGFLRAGAQRA